MRRGLPIALALVTACAPADGSSDGSTRALTEISASPAARGVSVEGAASVEEAAWPEAAASPEEAAWLEERARPPTPRRAADSPSSESCGECHAEVYRQWRQSGHAGAFASALFTREYGIRQNPWCRGCHAPRTGTLQEGDAGFSAAAAEGVGCASCHVRGGVIQSARVSGRAPHPSEVDSALSTSEVCAGCHEFAHPRQDLMVQSTITEHAWSRRGDTPCQSCHMPARAGHRFAGLSDRRLMRSALEVGAVATRHGDGARLTLTLRSGAGHAVPTGDLARRLEITARSGAAQRSARLGRFVEREGTRLVEVSDTRVPERGAREVTIDLASAGARVRWRVDLLTLPLNGDTGPLDDDRGALDEATLRYPLARGAARVQPTDGHQAAR